MVPQRKIDVVLDSVRRLLRIGATANLFNLLQKQHPADLAQVLAELPERDRKAAFSIVGERSPKLAMEAVSSRIARLRKSPSSSRKLRQTTPSPSLITCPKISRAPCSS